MPAREADTARSWPRSRIVALALLCSLSLAALYGFVIEPARLTVRRTEIALPGWPEKLANLQVAVFADLHAGAPFIDVAKIRRIVETTNAARPDLILLAGDFVIHDVLGGRFMEPRVFANELRHLTARHGVFATLGNHDWAYRDTRVADALKEVGIPVLEDRAVRIGLDGGAIWLVGLSDESSDRSDVRAALRQLTDDAPAIAFTHSPDLFPKIPARIALTIAGHTHGGQVALPFIGRPIVPSVYGQRYAIGHIVENGRHLFVTPGIGTSILPVRFGVPPEISILTIR
jgi:predicted MPP superfamily phosphohydrolase